MLAKPQMIVRGTAKAQYTQKFPVVTVWFGADALHCGPCGGTKKFVPKIAATKVAGSNRTVVNAITFIAALSRVATLASWTEAVLSRWETWLNA